MEQIIYADVLFLIDVSMDFLALYITAFVLKLKFRTANCIPAASLGAVFSVISVILRAESLIASIAVSIAMCFIAFLGNRLLKIAEAILMFYFSNMLLGGAMTAVFNLFNNLTDSDKDMLIYGEVNTVSSNMPVAVFLVGFVLIFVAVKILMRIFSKVPANVPFEIYVQMDVKADIITVIEDSGNLLTEPISGEPVIFLKESTVRRLSGDETVSALKMQCGLYTYKNRGKIRVVVFKTVSGSDMCACIKPRKITVNGKDCAAWIAIGKSISRGDIDGIVPSSLVR